MRPSESASISTRQRTTHDGMHRTAHHSFPGAGKTRQEVSRHATEQVYGTMGLRPHWRKAVSSMVAMTDQFAARRCLSRLAGVVLRKDSLEARIAAPSSATSSRRRQRPC